MRPVLAALVVVLLASGPIQAAAPTPPGLATQASVTAAGSIVIVYPKDWQAAVTAAGTVIGIAGPITDGARPAAAILLARGRGEMREIMDSAARGVEKTGQARLLSEQHLSASRWARYYLRGSDRASEYVVVGVAQRGDWIATLVATDRAGDPELPVRAKIFERILASLIIPG